MPKLSRILWSLTVMFFVFAALAVSVGIILLGVAAAGLFGVYRCYLARKRWQDFGKRPYVSGEIIDLKPRMRRF